MTVHSSGDGRVVSGTPVNRSGLFSQAGCFALRALTQTLDLWVFA